MGGTRVPGFMGPGASPGSGPGPAGPGGDFNFMDFLNPLAMVGNLVGGIAGVGYQAWAQQHQWDREDTAVQRRVADLRAAGLSPTLAAGSAAQSSSPINIGPMPRMDVSPLIEAALAKQSIIKSQDSLKTEAMQRMKLSEEIDLMRSMNPMKLQSQELTIQAKELGLDVARVELEIKRVSESIAKKYGLDRAQVEFEARREAKAILAHNLEYSRRTGAPSGSMPGGQEAQIFGLLLHQLERLFGGGSW